MLLKLMQCALMHEVVRSWFSQVKGISSIGGHAGERTACVNEFARLFGRMPLVQRDMRTHAQGWRLRLSTVLDRAI
jgi:hypothetical protein